MKKFIALLLVFSMLTVFCAAAQAQDLTEKVGITEKDTFTLSVVPFGNENAEVNWWYSEVLGRYCLFFPAKTDLSALKLKCSENEIKVGEVTVKNGDVTDVFAKDTDFTVKCGGKEYPLTVFVSANIPSMYITTESGSLDYINASKENKESGTVTIIEDGKITENAKALKSIKGRGNSTWEFPKKPYNIKFEKKTDLFGMGKAKKWTLLASYVDQSLVHNAYGWYYAEQFGIPYTSDYQYVDLWINGDYMGNYIVCESVEIGETRIDLNDLDSANEDANEGIDLDSLPRAGTGINGSIPSGLEKDSAKWVEIPTTPENITGGYILECDFFHRYVDEISGFVTRSGQCVTVKSPELASESEVKYIKEIFEDALEALESENGYNSKGKYYTEYFDMDSFVAMYILQELSKNVDAGVSSFYIIKPENSEKLVFAPVWDMDYAFGAVFTKLRFGENIANPANWWANSYTYWAGNRQPTMMTVAFRHTDFRKLVSEKWKNISENKIIENGVQYVKELSESLQTSAVLNAIRWKCLAGNDFESVKKSFISAAEISKNFVLKRKEYLDKGFGDKSALLFYNSNGGEGAVHNYTIAEIGDSVIAAALEQGDENRLEAPEGFEFAGWNTKADGSGTMFQIGEKVLLSQSVTTLYAIWKKIPPAAYAPGDIDNDKNISSADARLALRAAVNLENYAPDSPEFAAADVNGSGAIDVADARLILRAAVGLEKLS